ncbi:STAS domain-containing protein [Pseudonocardia alaniniphila]|uniref:STAS domain-containing protein n=1 Tax=Pseudonocardia alaniniphila TaxID=75291 RepID=A0ABS9TK88_9PSEU|nr:STAS domain-containing protein [Pseudonocardia alaniniphila]MCH6168949.1 STAS domain-containing protein [Pseudonocardia alaniniphila]
MDVSPGAQDAPSPELARFTLTRRGGSSAEVTVHVIGEIDLLTEPALTRCLAEQLRPPCEIGSLVVDLTSVTFVGARGLSALLAFANSATSRDVEFRVAGCSPQVLRCLDIIDPHDTLPRQARPRRSGSPRQCLDGVAVRGRRRAENRGW